MGFKNRPATIGGHTLYIGITGIPNGTSCVIKHGWKIRYKWAFKWDTHLETMNFQAPCLIPRG